MIRFIIEYTVMTVIACVIGFYVLESVIVVDKALVGEFSQHASEVIHD
jgi:hypothetical protein